MIFQGRTSRVATVALNVLLIPPPGHGWRNAVGDCVGRG